MPHRFGLARATPRNTRLLHRPRRYAVALAPILRRLARCGHADAAGWGELFLCEADVDRPGTFKIVRHFYRGH
jgi:hypothetical protein